MTSSVSGGCACGAIRYAADREPVAMLNCHCDDCQLSSGAPFASGIVLMTADLHVTGTPKAHTIVTAKGHAVTRTFCSECGTPLFTHSAANAQFISIRFPTLDDPSRFKPALDIYTGNAQPWVCLDPAIPHFPASP